MSVRNTFPQQRPTLNLDFANSKTLDPRITFSRTTTATYVDEDGLIKIAAADESRFDHDPETGECLGLLVEEQRSNLLTYSTFYGGNGLSNVGINTNVSGISAPDGTFTAAEMYGSDSTNNVKYMYKGYSTNTLGTYTTSVFMKYKNERYTVLRMNDNTGANGCLQRIDIQNGIFTDPVETGGTLTGAASTIAAYPNGWYRVSLTGTFVDALTQVQGSQVYITTYGATTSTNGIYLWGAQLEAGAFPTSYIPRPDASTATRNPDNVSMTGDNFSDWYNQSEGTIYVSQKLKSIDTVDRNSLVYLINGGSGNDIFYNVKEGDTNIFVFGDDGTNYSRWQENGDSTDTKAIWAYDVSGDDFKPYWNGIEGVNEPTSNTPSATSHTQLEIGATADAKYNGHISKLSYYPTRLSNDRLQNLTK